jgi:hypothetical protein
MSSLIDARRLLGLTLIGGATALMAVSVAHAGSYVIENCPSAPQGNSDPGPWVIFGSPQSAKAGCGGGPGDWIGPRGASMSPGSNAGVQVAVPSGSAITIREAKVWWYVPQETSGATTFALAASSGGVLGESATPLERRGSPDVYALPSSTTSLVLDDYCSNDDAGQGCTFGDAVSPNLLLFGSQLTLQDATLPSGRVTGGGLASAAPLSGVESIAYEAADGDSGVRQVTLLIDGQVAAQSDYGAECPYANFLACPATESGSINWNSATVSDGQHSLALVVENVAQNPRTIYAATITTLNRQAGLGTLPGPGIGGGLDGSPPAGAGNGAGASHAAQLRLGLARSISRSFSRSAVTLRGRLLDGAGHPIAGAMLDVLQRSANSGAMHVVADPQSRADGTFATDVPAGSSRVLEVAYRAFAGDAGYSAQASLRESVAAGIQLKVSPTRTASSGTITLSGRVSGPVPAQGVLVGLLVHYRGRWEPFRTPRTDSRGRFNVAYQFQGSVGRFPFRAQVFGGQTGFAYAHGESGIVAVTTR